MVTKCAEQKKMSIQSEMYWKEIFLYSTCDYTQRLNSRPNKLCHLYHTLKYFFLKCDTRPLLFGVEKNIPYKGLHLSLSIIPEEYNIIIYCHTKWQWEQCLCFILQNKHEQKAVKRTCNVRLRCDAICPCLHACLLAQPQTHTHKHTHTHTHTRVPPH